MCCTQFPKDLSRATSRAKVEGLHNEQLIVTATQNRIKKHNQAQDRSDRFQQPSINHYLNAQAVLVLVLLRKRQVVALLAHLTVDSSRFCSSADLYRIDVDLNES